MARVTCPAEAARSEHWLRVLVNEHPGLLATRTADALGWPAGETPTWLSPVAADDHAEYRDECFLARLGIQAPAVPLDQFWPRKGPQWDGLGTATGGRPILIEAKAHVEETVTSPCAAGGRSLTLIQQSLTRLKAFLGSGSPHDWSRLYYQYTNRLAHLYYLRELNRIDAYLVLVYFCHAPDVPRPVSEDEWRGAIRLLKCTLGLGRAHRLSPYVAEVFIDARQLAPA